MKDNFDIFGLGSEITSGVTRSASEDDDPFYAGPKCPKCGSDKVQERVGMDVIVYMCLKCGREWELR